MRESKDSKFVELTLLWHGGHEQIHFVDRKYIEKNHQVDCELGMPNAIVLDKMFEEDVELFHNLIKHMPPEAREIIYV